MQTTRYKGVLAACLLLASFSLAAQNPANDPSSPNNDPAASAAMTGANSATSTQGTPGVANPRSRSNANSSYMTDSGAGAADESQADKDRQFLAAAAQGSMAEIKLGQLASEKASDERVRLLGQKMVTGHTVLSNNLKPFADRMGLQPPAKLKPRDQADYDRLSGLSGADFDHEYVATLMKDHSEDLTAFRREAASANDQDLKMTVMKGESAIERHKQMIDKLGASMGVKPAS